MKIFNAQVVDKRHALTLYRRPLEYAFFTLSIIPVVLFSYVFFKSLSNFPFYDDFYWYVKPIVEADGHSFLTKLRLVVQQHVDHRIILLKGLTLLISAIGPFDFRVPMVITYGLFLLFSVHLAVRLHQITGSWFFGLPCLFILYQFIDYTAVFSYGLTTMGVLLFLYFGLYYAWLTTPWAYGVTGLMAVLCVLSNTNGLFILPILSVIYALTHRFRTAFLYFLLTITIPIAYVSFDYQWNVGTMQRNHFLEEPGKAYLFLAEFIGSSMNVSQTIGYALAVTTGTIMLICTGWIFWLFLRSINWKRRYIRPIENSAEAARHISLTAICMLGFLVLTSLLIITKRFAGTELINNIAPHYRQYSMFIFCFCYVVGLLQVFPNRAYRYACLAFLLTLGSNAASYAYIHHDLRQYYLALRADAYNWQYNGSFLFFPPIERESIWQAVSTDLNTAYQKQLIKEDSCALVAQVLPNALPAKITQTSDAQVVEVAVSAKSGTYLSTIFLVLKNQRATFFFPFINALNSPRNMFRHVALISATGRSVINKYIPKRYLPEGTYRSFLYDEDQHTLQPINQIIRIQYAKPPV